MNGKIVHIAGDGTQTDVTEGVQALYDLVIQSMDWGSGFLSFEDALPVAEIARLSGFETLAEAERYVREARHRKEAEEWLRVQSARRPDGRPEAYDVKGREIPHDHVWSSAGKCMWFACLAEQESGPAQG